MPYSHPQPLDRRQMIRQSRHLLPGAVAFAGTAGFINSVALGCFRSPVSHMTGAVSYFGLDLATHRGDEAAATLVIIAGFVAGAALAGFIVGARELMPGRRYGFALLGEAALLAAAMALMLAKQRLGVALIAMACGLQNGTTSSYCGLMIRTTHVTGTVTDIGVMLGHWLRHRRIEHWKLRFMIAVVTAFGAGVWIGARADASFGPASLAIAAGGCGIAGTLVWLRSPRSPARTTPGEAETGLPRTSSFPER